MYKKPICSYIKIECKRQQLNECPRPNSCDESLFLFYKNNNIFPLKLPIARIGFVKYLREIHVVVEQYLPPPFIKSF